MITVQLRKRINHHLPKGTRGTISNSDYTNYGIGDDIIYPFQINVFINNAEMRIANTNLEIADDNGSTRKNQSVPKESQLALL